MESKDLSIIKILKTGEVPDDESLELAKEQFQAEVMRRMQDPSLIPQIKRRGNSLDYKFRKEAVELWGKNCCGCGKPIADGDMDIAHIIGFEMFPEFGWELWNVRPKHRACHKAEDGAHSILLSGRRADDMRNLLKKTGGYDNTLLSLADEINAARVEFGFTMRWDLISMYHTIGSMIVSHRDTVDLKRLSYLTAISERNLYRAVQFSKKFPDLQLLPDGKNVSWHIIVNKYLPVASETTTKEEDQKEDEKTTCPRCGFVWKAN
jgi:hypothetical protein